MVDQHVLEPVHPSHEHRHVAPQIADARYEIQLVDVVYLLRPKEGGIAVVRVGLEQIDAFGAQLLLPGVERQSLELNCKIPWRRPSNSRSGRR